MRAAIRGAPRARARRGYTGGAGDASAQRVTALRVASVTAAGGIAAYAALAPARADAATVVCEWTGANRVRVVEIMRSLGFDAASISVDVAEAGAAEEVEGVVEGVPIAALKAKQDHPTHSALDGGHVSVLLDEETVAALPVMSLCDVQRGSCERAGAGPLLATYEGIVYDVTQFADAHPGGRELLLTATGCDLGHYFRNYTVHGASSKAAEWLAPLAVGKLSVEDCATIEELSTPAEHVSRRAARLRNARRRLLAVASTLPACIAVRTLLRFVKSYLSRRVARWLAARLPIAVPGVTPGSEPLPAAVEGVSRGSVAVIGGGIAGCGAAWMLARDGFEVTVFEARPATAGNARTFDWVDFGAKSEEVVNVAERPGVVKSCVSVTAWPPLLYKNYTALLSQLGVETVAMPLSWFLNSKVPGFEGTLWGADPRSGVDKNELRGVFEQDFARYAIAENIARRTTEFFTLAWAPWKRGEEMSMYSNHTGLGAFNPFNVIPLYTLCKCVGVSEAWWDIIFTPYYTASFLVDELRPFPAVFGPIIEAQIPLNPTKGNSWWGSSSKSEDDCKLTTCVTWADAGSGIRQVFAKLVTQVSVKTDARVVDVLVLPNGKKRVRDEHDTCVDVDRVVFACPCNAVGNIHKDHTKLAEIVFNAPVYGDDLHPDSGHMHAVMHSDSSVIDERYREEFLSRGSNYVEVTRLSNGKINIENQYNFGVQTPGHGVYDMKLEDKPVMLISHALGEGKSIDKSTIRGGGNHARAHPLYSGWNVAAQLSLRLCQGKDGLYYCSNWTTPGNCHDMSLLSGMLCAHAIGAAYPFPDEPEAKKDFHRLNDLMGVF